MERTVVIDGESLGAVSLEAPVLRYAGNPILTAADVNRAWRDPGLQVVTVHNAGAAAVGGQTAVLFRSHLRSGMSVLGIARSADGVTDWRIESRPALVPATRADDFAAGVDIAAVIEMESGGVEDARLNPVDGTIAVTYSAYHSTVHNRVRVALATTDDLTSFRRHGPMLDHDMRNVVIFPEQFDGRYVGLFRPNDAILGDVGGAYTQIRIGTTQDFRTGSWDIEPEPIMRTGAGPSAFSDKIGPGAPPVRSRHGWLNLFHGVRTTMDGNPYVLGTRCTTSAIRGGSAFPASRCFSRRPQTAARQRRRTSTSRTWCSPAACSAGTTARSSSTTPATTPS
jgi:predicted GH43/DUF377 family glycosyl hydrolase